MVTLAVTNRGGLSSALLIKQSLVVNDVCDTDVQAVFA